MLNLNDRKWKEFRICDIFSIHSGKRLTKSDMHGGRKPFIGATDSNNGIAAFVSNSNVSEDHNVLGVNYNGSVMETFYHPYVCVFSDDVKRFHTKHIDGNKYVYLFLRIAILRQKGKYAYGYKFNEVRMRQQYILLPIDADDQPDYAFMEQFIKEREQKKIQAYAAYVDKMASHSVEVMPLNEKEWSPFVIGDLFTVEIGKAIDGNKINKTSGKSAYITRRESNNGVDGFIDYEDKSYRNEKFPVISIGNETANPYVQGYPFYTGTKVNILCPKMSLSKYTLLFVVQSLRMLKNKYSYSFTVNSARLKRQIVLLPVNASGQPDWDYMEQYVKQKIYAIQRHYLQKKLGEF